MSEQKKKVQAIVTTKTLKELKKLAIDDDQTLPDFVGKVLDTMIEKKLKKINDANVA